MKVDYIGFCGAAGVGKTTACNMIREFCGCGSHIFPWAAELKRIATQEFGWDGKKDEKGRKLLQLLGTECGRMYGGDMFWIDKWHHQIAKYLNECDEIQSYKIISGSKILILNDDTRFDNEAKCIKDKNGIIIKLIGRGIDLGENSGHSSESGINPDYIDITIDNSGSKDDLKIKLKNCLMLKIPSVSVENEELLEANPDCDHDIINAPGGGVKCTKCSGWFCY